MPTTVNRNYPYPALTDAPNIPLALENLANAIDNDINTVAASVPQGMASELETRATLLEGRLTTLENKRIQTRDYTATYSRPTVTVDIPEASIIAYGIINLRSGGYCSDPSISMYRGANWEASLSLSNGKLFTSIKAADKPSWISLDEPYFSCTVRFWYYG